MVLWILGTPVEDSKNAKKIIKNFPHFTYVTGFDKIYSTQITSDVGWGCTIRSGQMLLSNGILTHVIGDNWKCMPKVKETKEYQTILSYFDDDKDSYLSIHNITMLGKFNGVEIGDWFGPNTICNSLEMVMNEGENIKLIIKVCENCVLYVDEVEEIMKNGNGIIILLPVRLGVNDVNPLYYLVIQSMFYLSNFLGIIGGKPKSSYYFTGFSKEKDELFYLNPHDNIRVHGEHIKLPSPKFKSISMDQIDPSMAFGFYCRTIDEFKELCEIFMEWNGMTFPIDVIDSRENCPSKYENDSPSRQDKDWEVL